MPVIKKPQSQLRDYLPGPLASLVETFFPPDELPLDSVAGPLVGPVAGAIEIPSPTRMRELLQSFGGRAPNPGLPMDEASRMARATEQGFTKDLYHGTNAQDFGEFHNPIKLGSYGEGDFGIHAADLDAGGRPTAANMMSKAFNMQGTPASVGNFLPENIHSLERGGRVMPLKVRMDNTLHMPRDVGIWRDPASWGQKMEHSGEYMLDNTNDPDALRELMDKADEIRHAHRGTANSQRFDPSGIGRSVAWQQDAKSIMDRRGIDSISYPNTTEGAGENSYLLLDPRKIRSRFAAFDPAKRSSRNILAGLGGLTAASTVSSHDKE